MKPGTKIKMTVKVRNLGNGNYEVLSPKPKPNQFHFTLTPEQAQTCFNIMACMMEERELVGKIWRTKKDRARARAAFRSYDRQLNLEYDRTGVEV